MVEGIAPLQTASIISLSISVAGGETESQPEGPFCLELDHIKGALAG